MAKDSKKEALEKMKKKGDCEKCGSHKHSTKEHGERKGEIKGEKSDNEDDNEE